MRKLPAILATSFLALPAFAWQLLPALSEAAGTQLQADALSPTCIAIKNPNTQDFDWDSLNSNEDFQQCLLVLAKNFENIEPMADWLRVQGFSNVSTVSSSANRVYLHAIWDVKQTGTAIPVAVNL